MRIIPSAVKTITLLAVLAELGITNAQVNQVCIDHGFVFEFEGQCNYDNALAAFTDQVFNAAGATTCTTSEESAKMAFDNKLAAANMDIDSLCALVYASTPKTPFTDAANKGDDWVFEQNFFDGRSDWQEEVQTVYETEDGSPTSILKEDAEAIKNFYQGIAQGAHVSWPGVLPNFQSSVVDELGNPTCETSAAMCCWPKDRQANDNNGNCNREYDVNCIDKDPGDNTNLCFVDTSLGNASNGFGSSDGTSVFPEDNNDGEGPIHCHGLAWSNDASDPTARYRGNNIYYVAMYDHMYVRGYVKNIPGAPMCGCVEQMPTVSRSDCTQVDLTETVRISYDSDSRTFAGEVTSIELDFNACQGINNRNNDLWAYMARLYYQGDITPEQFGQAGKIITDDGCDVATEYHFHQKGLRPGHNHDETAWTNIAGEGLLKQQDDYGKVGFELSMAYGDASPHGIFYRGCADCVSDHKSIFYRRLTAIPEGFDLYKNLFYMNAQEAGNIWGVDFELYSTYEDALAQINEWKCPGGNYNYGASFPGECSPDGNRISNSRTRLNSANKDDFAYYVNKPEDAYPMVVETTAIQATKYNPYLAGGVALLTEDGTIIMTGTGRDIWNDEDEFNYYSQPATDDHTVIVHVSSVYQVYHKSWMKAGIMFRQSMDISSPHMSLFLTGSNGVCGIYRHGSKGGDPNNNWSDSLGCASGTAGVTSAWLKIEKRIDTYSLFYSLEEEVTEWTLFKSQELPQVGDSYNIGLAVCSQRTEPAEAIFEQYYTDQYYFPSAAPSVSSAPTAFVASMDIGNVAATGSTSLSSSGGYTVKASGSDIWGGSDEFHFVQFSKSDANLAISALIKDFNAPNHSWAKAGVMIRATLDANSAHYSMFLSGNNGLANQFRRCAGCGSEHRNTISGKPDSVYVKVEKTGTVFQAYVKFVGDSEWSIFGEAIDIPDFPATYYVGLAVTSHSDGNIATLSASELEIVP